MKTYSPCLQYIIPHNVCVWLGGGLWLYLDSWGPFGRLCSPEWTLKGGCSPARGRDQHPCNSLHPNPEWDETKTQAFPSTAGWGYHWGEKSRYSLQLVSEKHTQYTWICIEYKVISFVYRAKPVRNKFLSNNIQNEFFHTSTYLSHSWEMKRRG